MFDTGAAIHVCPWWFGNSCPTYHYDGLPIANADGTAIKVYGLRTVYFQMTESKDDVVALTFLVCASPRSHRLIQPVDETRLWMQNR